MAASCGLKKKYLWVFFITTTHIFFFCLWQIFKKNFNDYIPTGISDKLKFATKHTHTHYVKVVKKKFNTPHTHTHFFLYVLHIQNKNKKKYNIIQSFISKNKKKYKSFFNNKLKKIALSKQLVRFLLEHCFRKLYLLRRALSNVRFIETYPNFLVKKNTT